MTTGITGQIVNNADDLANSNFKDIHLQGIRRLQITIEVIDERDRVLETLHGFAIDGSIDSVNNSLIKRTGTISLSLREEFIPSKYSILWMTNRIRVYVGIDDMSSTAQLPTNFLLGTFYISENNVTFAGVSDTWLGRRYRDETYCDITLEDMMMRFDNTQLEYTLIIPEDINVSSAIQAIIEEYGEFNHNIQFSEELIPHRLEFMPGTSITDILMTLRDLYMDWTCYYDEMGQFIFEKIEIQTRRNMNPVWTYMGQHDQRTESTTNFNFRNVRNRVVVHGAVNEDGLFPSSEAIITNPDSHFHKDVINERTEVVVDDNLRTARQCDAMARFVLFQKSSMQETISFSGIPIYFLSANHIIEIPNLQTGMLDKYVVESVNTQLTINALQAVEARRLYFHQDDITSDLEDVVHWIETFNHGMRFFGWLRLGEERIEEYFGLRAREMPKLTVGFEYNQREDRVITVSDSIVTDDKSMIINLHHFRGVTGESGEQENEYMYADRQMAKALVQVVLGSHISVTRMRRLNRWFLVGMSEFIHGADEITKLVIGNDTQTMISTERLNSLIYRAKIILEGGIVRPNNLEDTVACYVIVKWIERRLSSGSIKNLFETIRTSNNTGHDILQTSILENMLYDDWDALVQGFDSTIENYIRSQMTLNWSQREVDTGSIAGSDHAGSIHLNAANVFDNSRASHNVLMENFRVEIRN